MSIAAARRRSRVRRLVRRGHRGGLTRNQQNAIGAGLIVVVFAAIAAREDAPTPAKPAAVSAAAVPFRAQPGAGACSQDDPTSSGCVTPIAAHGLAEIGRVFGGAVDGKACWDKHAWNPSSDHPKGRGCDLFFGRSGAFPTGRDLDDGWRVAHWLRKNSHELHVRYLIFQGRIWQAEDNRDSGGWGTRYSGGGVYDAGDATGGHYDHIHVSFQAA